MTPKLAKPPEIDPGKGLIHSEIFRLHIADAKPTPKLKNWLEAAGISWTARQLLVSRGTLQSWRRDGKYERIPSVKLARYIILLSHERPFNIGPLTYEDIWGAVVPQREVREVRNAKRN